MALYVISFVSLKRYDSSIIISAVARFTLMSIRLCVCMVLVSVECLTEFLCLHCE